MWEHGLCQGLGGYSSGFLRFEEFNRIIICIVVICQVCHDSNEAKTSVQYHRGLCGTTS